jgi:hypothetical protein
MKYLILLFGMINSGLFAQNWSPEWSKPEELKAIGNIEMGNLLAGRYESKYFLMGHSEPQIVTNYEINIDDNGNMKVYNSIKKDNPGLLFECVLKITNNQGHLTIGTDSVKLGSNLMVLSVKMFSGVFYIAKDRSGIMFGNDIEVDGGPASAWRKKQK